MSVLVEFRDLVQGRLTVDEFRSQKVQFDRSALLDTFDDFAKHKLLWKVISYSSKGEEIRLVDLLFEVVYPDITDGVVLPVGFTQSISIFSNSTVSCGHDIDCVRTVYVSLLDYVELYFGTSYRNSMKIKGYQKNIALVEGHEAVANLRVGEVVGYPETLPEVKPLLKEALESES